VEFCDGCLWELGFAQLQGWSATGEDELRLAEHITPELRLEGGRF